MSSLKLIKEAEAANYLGLSVSTLRQGRMNGVRSNRVPCPPFIKLGKAVRYCLVDLETWIASQRITPAPKI
jgi:predicted DNA-binding transcriptional regulator AlpA